MTKCPYYGECGVVNNCDMYEQCRVKEWIDDFYKVEKLYQDSEKKYNAASFIAKNLQKRCRHLTQRNTKLNKVKDILLNQLVVLDGECVTVQITQKQFEEYNEFKAENEKFKNFVAHNLFDINCDNWLDRFIDYFEKWKHELVAENEELKNKLKMQKNMRIVVECGKQSFKNIMYKYTLFQQCLDEIEEIINFIFSIKNCDNAYYCKDKLKDILQLIKQAKEGGE